MHGADQRDHAIAANQLILQHLWDDRLDPALSQDVSDVIRETLEPCGGSGEEDARLARLVPWLLGIMNHASARDSSIVPQPTVERKQSHKLAGANIRMHAARPRLSESLRIARIDAGESRAQVDLNKLSFRRASVSDPGTHDGHEPERCRQRDDAATPWHRLSVTISGMII
jgi:hypothetical protein